MSPSQRKVSKKMIGIYLEEKEIRRFKAACEATGMTMTAYLSDQIQQKLNEYEQRTSEQSPARTPGRNIHQTGNPSDGTK